MINNIQILRAVAALNIVFYHAFGIGRSYGYDTQAFDQLAEWSANGVDIFFVISGFVMYYTHHTHPRSAGGFLLNRIKRIVPLYWSITLGFVAMVLLLPSAFRQASFDLPHTLTSLLFISHAVGFRYPVLVPGWTLELEMLFYALFAAALLVPRVPVILTVPLALAAAMVTGSLDPMVMEFAMGMLAAWCYTKGYLQRGGWLLFVLGAGALLVNILWQVPLHRALVWGPSAFLLVLGACYIPQVGRGCWVSLGSASYGIYLIHTLTLPLFYKVIRNLGVPGQGMAAELQVPMCLLFSACIGWLVYRYFEKPLARII